MSKKKNQLDSRIPFKDIHVYLNIQDCKFKQINPFGFNLLSNPIDWRFRIRTKELYHITKTRHLKAFKKQ